MQDPGLNHRLQQRSRRSGFVIGLTMALTLLVCVGSFTVIYAQLEPVVSDFVTAGTDEPVATSAPDVAEAAPTSAPAGAEGNAAAPQPTAAPTAEPTAAPTEEPTPEDDEFTPDYQVDSNDSVNLRPGPGVNTGEAIVAVPMDAPLMYLGESEPTQDPAGDGLNEGDLWLRFRTEDGEEGWIREIDVTEYTP